MKVGTLPGGSPRPLNRRGECLMLLEMPELLKSQKYLPLRDFDDVTNALNFDTADCHVLGGCDVYTTKAAGGDKKLYKNIEKSLESQYASVLSFSASLSSQQAQAAGPSLNLARASPFGSLSQISSRRTFAYLIATLNASHPDYDFSHLLRPADFRREKNIRKVINTLDTTLYNLRPNPSNTYFSDAKWSPNFSANVPSTPSGTEKWNPRMWHLIDKEMVLKECSVYCYAPEEDPYDGEEGALWSFNYFFFNKAKKRVCYLYLRGISIIETTSSGLKTPVSAYTPAGARSKRCASGTWSISSAETGKKRARYWLGDRAGDAELVGDDDDRDDDVEIEDEVDADKEGHEKEQEQDDIEDGDNNKATDEERHFMALSSTDEGRSESPCKGRDKSF